MKCRSNQGSLAISLGKLPPRSDLVERHIRWNVVVRHDVPHAIFHALDFISVVGATISLPARIVAVEPLLVLGRLGAPLPVAATVLASRIVAIILSAVVVGVLRQDGYSKRYKNGANS
jgi:hypothetical protein